MIVLRAILIGLVVCVSAWSADPAAPDWVPRVLAPDEAAEGFYPLFNGKDLDGWHIRGANQGAFAVKDERLVTTGAGGGDWIFTTREYANFVLRFEYRVFKQDDNSGVAIRATAEGNPAFSGMEIQVLHPEKEPRVGSAGALYASVKPAVCADHPLGEWNAVEVLCDGPRVRTVMNGQPLYDVNIDTLDSPDKEHTPLKDRAKTGFIALQDYGKYVEFRKIRLKPLPGGPGWRPLFNGKDLSGWKTFAACNCSVVDGLLRLDNTERTRNTGLRTVEAFGNFELRLMVRAHTNARGGVVVRGVGEEPSRHVSQVRIDNHGATRYTGGLAGWIRASELRAIDHCWCQMDIVVQGRSTQVAVNGKTVVNFINSRQRGGCTGWIGIQAAGPVSVIEFKDIEIKPLS